MNYKYFLMLLLCICGRIQAWAQDASLREIVSQVENNNLYLKALRQSVEANSANSKAQYALDGIEIEYAYLLGPDNIKRHDYSISQSFDIAKLSGAKKRAFQSEQALYEYEYKAARVQILREAQNMVCEIVYRNALISKNAQRLEYARKLVDAYRNGADTGAISSIDIRKVSLELLTIENDIKLLRLEKEALLADLAVLNASIPISIDSEVQLCGLLPASYELWLSSVAQNNSILAEVAASVSLSQSKLELSKSESAPSLNIGYMAELVPGSNFRGVKAGLSIPLWSSSLKIKAAKAELQAIRAEQDAKIAEFNSRAKALYDKAALLAQVVSSYQGLEDFNSQEEALNKSLEIGQLSLADYYTEVDFLYQVHEKALRSELDYALAIVELNALGY